LIVGQRLWRWSLVAVCGLAFLLRIAGLDAQSLWRDEVDAVRFAFRPGGELLQTFAQPGQNGPLYSLLLRPWLWLAGDGEFALRFFSLFFGVLSVPLIYRLGRRLFAPGGPLGGRARDGAGMAWLAALLAATSPYLVWYGQEGKMYTLTVVLVLVSMDRYLAALERGGWHRWLGYVLATSAAFYVHLIAAFVVPAQVLLFLALKARHRRLRWRPWLVSLAALTLPYLPLLAWQAPLLFQPAETGFDFVPLQEMIASLLVSYSQGVVWAGTFWVLALVVGLVLAAGLSWWRRHVHRDTGLVLACWILVPILGLFGVSLVRPLYTARYLIFALPAFLLVLVMGVAAVAGRWRPVAMVLVVALLAVNGWGLWLQGTTPVKADFRSATRYVSERLAPGDLILFQIPYGRYSFDYYLARQPSPSRPAPGRAYRAFLPIAASGGGQAYHRADGLYTNAGMSPQEVDHRMAALVGQSRVVWLVATEVPLWDERGLVQAWLDQQGSLTDEAQFVRVGVYRYALR
jgi:mannosyltransferase